MSRNEALIIQKQVNYTKLYNNRCNKQQIFCRIKYKLSYDLIYEKVN